jgi:putative DNA primase/helicase
MNTNLHLDTQQNKLITPLVLTPSDLNNLYIERGLDIGWTIDNVKRISQADATKLLGYRAPSDGLWLQGHGEYGQFRPDTPWKDKDGKVSKYLTPKKWGAMFPARGELGNYWTDLEELKKHCLKIDGHDYVLTTEGFFKAIAGCSIGIPTIALCGVWQGLTPKDAKGNRYLLPELKAIAEAGIGFILGFDSDVATNPNVQHALNKLGNALMMENVPVRSITGMWKPSQGKGMDDFIKNNGKDAFMELAKAAKTLRVMEQALEPKQNYGKIPPADVVALEIAEEYRDKLLFNNQIGHWTFYGIENDGVWTQQTEIYIKSIVCKSLDAKGISGYGSDNYVVSIVKRMQTELIAHKWNEANAMDFIPFKNGVLELATGKLLPHSPGYKFTWFLPREHNILATEYPTISKFLEEATNGNKELEHLLICYCNAVLKGRSDLQKFLHLIGQGGTGKGTFTWLVINLIGEMNVHSTTLPDWCGNNFESANAYGKRLVVFPDEDKFGGKVGKFKSLTGGDNIRCERKRKDAYSYTYKGMVLMASNYPVFKNESSSGLDRRKVMVPLNHKPKQRDINLKNKIESELDAFTNHLLAIPDEEVTKTLLGTKEVAEVNLLSWTEKTETDSIAWWLDGHVIFGSEYSYPIGSDKTDVNRLFGHYYTECKNAGKSPVSVTEFSSRLLDLVNNTLGIAGVSKVKKASGYFMHGMRLREVPNDDDIPTYMEQMTSEVVGMNREQLIEITPPNPAHPAQSLHGNGYNPASDPASDPAQPEQCDIPNESDSENAGYDAQLKALQDKDCAEYAGFKQVNSEISNPEKKSTPKSTNSTFKGFESKKNKINLGSRVKIKDARYTGTYIVVGGNGRPTWQLERTNYKQC